MNTPATSNTTSHLRVDLKVYTKKGDRITVRGLPSPAGTVFGDRQATATELASLAQAVENGKRWVQAA